MNTVLIIGDSPFLGKIEDRIHYVLDKYPSLGINNAIRKYNISTHVFQDVKFINLTNAYPDTKTLTLYSYGDMIQKTNKELYNSYAYNFKENTEHDLLKDGRLAWCGFTHDYALSYCINKGYESIVLIGAADFTGNKHFLTDEEFNYSEKLKFHSKKFIEKICTKRARIYTCNFDSILEIPRVDIDTLLNETFS